MTHSSERAALKNSLRFGGLMACAIVLCASANPVFAAAMQEPNSGPEVAAAATPSDNATDDMASAQNAKTDGSTDTDAANSTNNSDATSNTDAAAQQQFSAPRAYAMPVFAAPMDNGLTQNNLKTGAAAATTSALQQQPETQPAAEAAPASTPVTSLNVSGTVTKIVQPDIANGVIGGLEIHPESALSSAQSGEAKFHTHLRILIPSSGVALTPASHADVMQNLLTGHPSDDPGTLGSNTPASLACVYQLAPQPSRQPGGCNPVYTSVNPAGGGGAIALVDAFHYPTAAADLNFFSRYFNLPLANIHVVYAGGNPPYISGSQPSVDASWNLEAALDIEWAHAMAPGAQIFLVEAQDDHISSLMVGVAAAQYLVAHNGGGEISMSWGGDEDSSFLAYDSMFGSAPSNVTQIASAGDTGSVVSYPASSPSVVGVGGTTLNRDANAAFVSETAWDNSGGGASTIESRPSFQNPSAIQAVVGAARGTPDVSMLADPETGVAIYNAGQWYLAGGTSLSSPLVAGLLNLSASNNGVFPNQAASIATLYANGGGTTFSRDITDGSCGANNAAAGYDFCTGMGSLIDYPYNTSTGGGPTSACAAGYPGNTLMDVTLSQTCKKSIYAQ